MHLRTKKNPITFDISTLNVFRYYLTTRTLLHIARFEQQFGSLWNFISVANNAHTRIEIVNIFENTYVLKL